MKQLKFGGFTLVEMVLVILLVGILAAVALPNFIDLRSDARDGASKSALGGMRSAVAIARAAIALREDTAAPIYPTASEMWSNAYNGSHPQLVGTNIMDPATGFPQNPWTLSTLTAIMFNSVYDCSAKTPPAILITPTDNRGWCYKGGTSGTSGIIWANSARSTGGTLENNF